MLRFILGLIGAAFAFVLLLSMGSDLATYFSSPSEESAEKAFHKEPKALPLASDGPFGKFNRQQLQRADESRHVVRQDLVPDVLLDELVRVATDGSAVVARPRTGRAARQCRHLEVGGPAVCLRGDRNRVVIGY